MRLSSDFLVISHCLSTDRLSIVTLRHLQIVWGLPNGRSARVRYRYPPFLAFHKHLPLFSSIFD